MPTDLLPPDLQKVVISYLSVADLAHFLKTGQNLVSSELITLSEWLKSRLATNIVLLEAAGARMIGEGEPDYLRLLQIIEEQHREKAVLLENDDLRPDQKTTLKSQHGDSIEEMLRLEEILEAFNTDLAEKKLSEDAPETLKQAQHLSKKNLALNSDLDLDLNLDLDLDFDLDSDLDVDLSALGLSRVPKLIALLFPYLVELDLSSNKFSYLPTLDQLKNLKKLFLQHNLLKRLPSTSELKCLETLNLSCNSLELLDASIGELPQLTLIDVQWNPRINTFPTSVEQLEKLRKFFQPKDVEFKLSLLEPTHVEPAVLSSPLRRSGSPIISFSDLPSPAGKRSKSPVTAARSEVSSPSTERPDSPVVFAAQPYLPSKRPNSSSVLPISPRKRPQSPTDLSSQESTRKKIPPHL